MRLKFGQILIAVLITAFFVLGVPILINECYRLPCVTEV